MYVQEVLQGPNTWSDVLLGWIVSVRLGLVTLDVRAGCLSFRKGEDDLVDKIAHFDPIGLAESSDLFFRGILLKVWRKFPPRYHGEGHAMIPNALIQVVKVHQ